MYIFIFNVYVSDTYINKNKLKIYLSGYRDDGVYCTIRIEDFKDNFYIIVNKTDWTESKLQSIYNELASFKINANKSLSSILKKKSFYGSETKYTFHIVIESGMNNLYKFKQRYNYNICHDNIKATTKYMVSRNISFCDWIYLGADYLYTKMYDEKEQLFISSNSINIHPINDPVIYDRLNKIKINFRKLWFDIECHRKSKTIYMISVRIIHKDNVKDFLLTLYDINAEMVKHEDYNIKNVTVQKYKCEYDLLIGFLNMWDIYKVDIGGGYNIIGFDWKEILQRCDIYNITPQQYNILTKVNGIDDSVKTIRINNQFTKYRKDDDEVISYIEMQGRCNIDVYKHVKNHYEKEIKEGLKLDNVSKHFFDGKYGKLDQSYDEMDAVYELYVILSTTKSKSEINKWLKSYAAYTYYPTIHKLYNSVKNSLKPSDIAKVMIEMCTLIGIYCLVDIVLCDLLEEKLSIISMTMAISHIANIDFEHVNNKGPVHRIINIYYKYITNTDYIFNIADGDYNIKKDNKFEGARVIQPEKGHHKAVVVVDFNSLYPTIIINYNLCHTNFKPFATATTRQINGIHFENKDSLSKIILTTINNERRLTKDLIKDDISITSDQKINLHTKQLALKLIANTIYGSFGCNGKLMLMPLAQTVTYIGRIMLEYLEKLIKDVYKCKVIYGDTDSIFFIPPVDSNDEKLVSDYGRMVAKEATKLINNFRIDELENQINKFDLEYESSFSDMLFFDAKKAYACKTYNNIIKYKGVPSVKRPYSMIERFFFNNAIEYKFNNQDIITKFHSDCLACFTNIIFKGNDLYSLSSYIKNITFKTIAHYARKQNSGTNSKTLYIHKDSNVKNNEIITFITDNQYDDRFTYTSNGIGLKLALDAVKRKEPFIENCTINYIFCEYNLNTFKLSDCQRIKVKEYKHFYNNRRLLYIRKIEYIYSMLHWIEKIVNETEKVNYIFAENLYNLLLFFNYPIPHIQDIIRLTKNTIIINNPETNQLLSNFNFKKIGTLQKIDNYNIKTNDNFIDYTLIIKIKKASLKWLNNSNNRLDIKNNTIKREITLFLSYIMFTKKKDLFKYKKPISQIMKIANSFEIKNNLLKELKTKVKRV